MELEFNYNAIKFWFDIGQTIFMFVLAVLMRVWATASARKSEVDTKLDGLHDRVSKIEVSTGFAPNHDHLREIYERLNDTDQKLSQLVGSYNAMEKELRLIHVHLLDNKNSR